MSVVAIQTIRTTVAIVRIGASVSVGAISVRLGAGFCFPFADTVGVYVRGSVSVSVSVGDVGVAGAMSVVGFGAGFRFPLADAGVDVYTTSRDVVAVAICMVWDVGLTRHHTHQRCQYQELHDVLLSQARTVLPM